MKRTLFVLAAFLMMADIMGQRIEYKAKIPADVTSTEAAHMEMTQIAKKAQLLLYENGAWNYIKGAFAIDENGMSISNKGRDIRTLETAGYIDLPFCVFLWDENYYYSYRILIGDTLGGLDFHSLLQAMRFVDLLNFTKQKWAKQQEDTLVDFDRAVSGYRELTVKPPVSEEQRRLMVQGDAATKRKLYKEALNYYQKAIDLDPVSSPNAYFNSALLHAQLNHMNSAIIAMKKYLMLVPGAADARQAQDKIYEWEFLIERNK